MNRAGVVWKFLAGQSWFPSTPALWLEFVSFTVNLDLGVAQN